MLKAFTALLLIGVVAGRVSRPYDIARLREAVESECKQYGAEEHIDEVMDGIITFVICVRGKIDQEALKRLQEAEISNASEELLRFVKTTCKNQDKINTCFNNMLDAVSPCTDPEERSKIDEAKQSLVETSDLFCKDDSKSFTEFINDGAFSCMEDQLYPLVTCTSKVQNLQNYKTINPTEACEKVEEMTSCIVKTLENCPKPSTATFVKTLFKTSFKGSSCPNLNREEENKIAVNVIAQPASI